MAETIKKGVIKKKTDANNTVILYPKTTADQVEGLSLTTTVGQEAITVGNDTLKIVTRDTDQTITGEKTFTSPIHLDEDSYTSLEYDTNKIKIYNDTSCLTYTYGGADLELTGSAAAGGAANLGSTSEPWTTLYISGNLTDGTNSVTIANIQEKVQVKRYI